jgi:hypothetical protein
MVCILNDPDASVAWDKGERDGIGLQACQAPQFCSRTDHRSLGPNENLILLKGL